MFAVLATVCLPMIVARAQEESAQITATVGIEGWVAGDEPLTVHAKIDAELLVTGVLRVSYGSAVTEIDVDIPAGGSKTYDILLRSPFRNGSVQVILFDADGQRLASQSITPQVAEDEVIVGVAGDPGLTTTLSALQTSIDGLSITALDVSPPLPRTDLDALSYLVSRDVDQTTWEWVSDGGRLVTTAGELSESPLSLDPIDTVPGTDVEWYSAGTRGEVFLVDGVGASEDWTKVIRPIPLKLIPTDQWGSPEGSLVQAASNSGDAGLADLPWLPFALVAYLLLIGPVNLMVLKRMKRRELAWVTIPAMATIAVLGFWVAGRQRLDVTSARHATVVVAGEHPYQRSVFVLAAGKAGVYSVLVPSADRYAVSEASTAFGGNVGTTSAGRLSAEGVDWELPQLGVGAVETWQSANGSIAVDASLDGDTPVLAVTNDTGLDIEHWGAVIGGEVHVAQQALASGQSATLRAGGAAAPWPGASFGDVLVEQRQIWDDTGWQVISPMGYAAQGEFSQSDSFVFGMATSTQMEAIVNGSPQMVDGPTMWTTPFSTQGFPSGKTIGRVVGVGDWRHIEASQGNIWIETDRIVTSYDVPTDATETTLRIAVAPVASIPLLFGGTSLTDVLAALGMLLLTAITLAATATWMSSRAASTRGAVGMSYLIAFTLGFLTFVGLGAEMLVYSNLGNRDPFVRGGREVFSILPNPYFALVDAVQHPLDQTALTSDTPYLPFEYMLRLRQGVSPDSVAPAIVGGVAPNNAVGRDLPRTPLWVYNVVIYLGLTAFALRRASINVRAPSTKIRKPKRLKGTDD